MSDRATEATELFQIGFNCAQAVLATFCESYDLPKDKAFQISSGLGGGVGRGEICGIVTGAVLVIGLKYGRKKDDDYSAQLICNDKVENFLKEFEKCNGSLICRNILSCDISSRNGLNEATQRGLFNSVCTPMLKKVVELLCQLGYDHGFEVSPKEVHLE